MFHRKGCPDVDIAKFDPVVPYIVHDNSEDYEHTLLPFPFSSSSSAEELLLEMEGDAVS